VVLQGAIGLLLLDQHGALRGRERLDAAGPLRGIQLPEGIIHTLVALEPDSVLLEIKEGPYVPASDKDFIAPFPPEGTAAAKELEASWRSLFSTRDP
jgi:cupin fold WbuC family metalloprotein